MNAKPFPWMCPRCREKTVVPIQKDYTVSVEHDGQSYAVTVPDAAVPTCTRCGEAIVTSDLGEQVSAEVRRLAHLLSPETMRDGREALGLTRSQLAATLRIPEATLACWEMGMQLQPHALDLLLRLYFDSHEVRRACPLHTNAAAGAGVLLTSLLARLMIRWPLLGVSARQVCQFRTSTLLC